MIQPKFHAENEAQMNINNLNFNVKRTVRFFDLISTANMAEHRRNLVFGYKRRMEKEYGMVISKDVVSVILLYSAFGGEWNLSMKSEDLILTDNNRCVHHNCSYTQRNTSWRSIYGKQICEKGKYEWTLRIKKVIPHSGNQNSWKTLFGIVKVKKVEDKLNRCWNRAPANGYGFVGSQAFLNRRQKAYGQKFEKEGDEITMYLDMGKKTLSYKINGIHYGVAFNVGKGPYRMAFAVCDGRHVVLL